ncbi:MAG: hypothetical protein HQ521_14430 [Bacteroidetes bacterium]|nr:hypothetical protein [Bacteroidota bacterium]
MVLLDYCTRNGIQVKLPGILEEIMPEIVMVPKHTNLVIEKWNIEELESFFSKIEFKLKTIKLNSYTTVIDIEKFIESHLDVSKTHNGESRYKPYYDRLLLFKDRV